VRIQDVCVAIASVKIRSLCSHAEDDEIVVPLVDGFSYEQLAQLSVSLGTLEIA
jgi:hypothetical protein